MADQSQQPTVTDPDNVGELSCDGPINVSIVGDRAVLTFTHVRPDATALFRDGTMNPIMIVRARIVITLENLNALRDLFNRLAQSGGAATPSTVGRPHSSLKSLKLRYLVRLYAKEPVRYPAIRP